MTQQRDIDWHLRPAATGDAEAMAVIEHRVSPSPWSAIAFFESLMASARGRVAVSDSRVLGFVVFSVAADEAEILNIAVDPDYQGRRIGSALLSAALVEVRLQGAANCFLDVRVSNQVAIRLYQSAGFLVAGRRNGYYRRGIESEDALQLVLST